MMASGMNPKGGGMGKPSGGIGKPNGARGSTIIATPAKGHKNKHGQIGRIVWWPFTEVVVCEYVVNPRADVKAV